MKALGMLIDGGSCLGAAVALHMIELKRIDAEFAHDALERNPVVDLFGCVIAHIFDCSLSGGDSLGHEVLALWLKVWVS